MITPAIAAKAYAAARAQMLSSPGDVPGQSEAAGGSSFGDMLKGVMTDLVSSSRQAETKMTQNVQGKADLVDVVTAISSAETSLETVIAVRDQVIAAYQQVMQMQI